MSDKRNWVNEFGEGYQCPELPEGFVDLSWHNDSSPSYGITRADGSDIVRIWMEHPEQEQREEPEQAERFMVARFSVDGEQLDWMLTDDWDRAVQQAREWAK